VKNSKNEKTQRVVKNLTPIRSLDLPGLGTTFVEQEAALQTMEEKNGKKGREGEGRERVRTVVRPQPHGLTDRLCGMRAKVKKKSIGEGILGTRGNVRNGSLWSMRTVVGGQVRGQRGGLGNQQQAIGLLSIERQGARLRQK